MRLTSAEANKLLRKMEEQTRNILVNEKKASIFHVASGENAEELRPDYDFAETQKTLNTLQENIRKVKHAINLFNTSQELPGFPGLTIDQALVYLPQLTASKERLQTMAAHLPKERVPDMGYSNIIDYEVINYEREAAEKAFNEAADLLSRMQLALDEVNSTVRMEVDVRMD